MTEPPDGGRQIGHHLLGVTVTWRYRLERILVKGGVAALLRASVEGLDNWPPAPFLMAVNHHSGWDPLLVLAVSPFRPRVTWFGPKEVDFSRGFRNRVMGFFGGMIPFNPAKTNLGSAFRAVRRVFDAGGALAITPEGTLGFRETKLLPFQEGAALFAAHAGVPILPTVVIGTSSVWLRKPVLVRFGKPIPVARGLDREGRQALTEQLRAAMQALLPTEEPIYPRRRPWGEFMSDYFNGPTEQARRRAFMAEVDRAGGVVPG